MSVFPPISPQTGAALREVVAAELDREVPEPVRVLARHLVRRWGDAVQAVLFYGSCLRSGRIHGELVDLYVLVDRYRRAHPHPLARLANRLLPPNVYYVERPTCEGPLRGKYAVVKLSHFLELVSPRTDNPYFWARFAQPVGLAYATGPEVRAAIEQALVQAVVTLYRAVRPLVPAGTDARTFWVRALRCTYASELRPEKPQRARELVERWPERYERLFELLEGEPELARESPQEARRAWRRRILAGKLLSVARLSKAAFTFRGGADYIAWKIERHSGVRVRLTPFQRRHPLLGALPLLLHLYRTRAIR